MRLISGDFNHYFQGPAFVGRHFFSKKFFFSWKLEHFRHLFWGGLIFLTFFWNAVLLRDSFPFGLLLLNYNPNSYIFKIDIHGSLLTSFFLKKQRFLLNFPFFLKARKFLSFFPSGKGLLLAKPFTLCSVFYFMDFSFFLWKPDFSSWNFPFFFWKRSAFSWIISFMFCILFHGSFLFSLKDNFFF